MEFFRKYIMPGFIFQSVVIGGGYATGRELIEFFFASGPWGGVLGMVVAALVFGAVMAAGFEFARVTGAYDYRHFCRALLGPGWVVFEVAFMIQLLLILSVIGSAAGEMIKASFGLSSLYGTLALMALIALLTFKGSESIKRVLSIWSLLLYSVYLILFLLAFTHFGGDIVKTYAENPVGEGWLINGVLYSGYNLAVLPAVLFAVSQQVKRRETVGSGFIAGAIAMVPALLFYVAMMALHPEIGKEPLPANFLMMALNIGWFEIIFQIVVFGTFVETGTAMLHAVNERLEASFAENNKHLPRFARPAVASGLLLIAIFAGEKIGIIDLIAQGYGLLTLVFIGILVIPLLTIGVVKIMRSGPARPREETKLKRVSS